MNTPIIYIYFLSFLRSSKNKESTSIPKHLGLQSCLCVKSASCSCRGPGFGPQLTGNDSQASVTLAPADDTLFWLPRVAGTRVTHTYIQANHSHISKSTKLKERISIRKPEVMPSISHILGTTSGCSNLLWLQLHATQHPLMTSSGTHTRVQTHTHKETNNTFKKKL